MLKEPEPYWSGPFSEALIVRLILSGVALAAASVLALRAIRQGEKEK